MVPRVATQRARERIEPGGDPQFGTLQMETPITAITRNATVHTTMTFRVNFFVANITTCPFRLDLGFGFSHWTCLGWGLGLRHFGLGLGLGVGVGVGVGFGSLPTGYKWVRGAT